MKYDEILLVVNEARRRFELTIDGLTSFIDFKQKGERLYLIHTEVPQELKGKGVAPAMLEKTLNYLEENKLKVVPVCSYVKMFLKRHPEWNRLL